jgi:gamma-glutamyltranspeptidase/glutathione hydrolase
MKGVITAGNKHTAEAGAEVLKAGGNAFDAAIAAGWMSFVAECTLTSAGGGGFLTGFSEKGQRLSLDFFVQTPKSKELPQQNGEKLNFYPVELDYGGSSQTFHAGLASVATPGCVAGLFHIHKTFGTIPMRELVQPAVELAKNGMKVDAFFAKIIQLVGPCVSSLPTGKKLFKSSGEFPKIGDLWKMAKFADTLEYLAQNGSGEFYRGEIARKFAEDSRSQGGYLTREDFENYRVIERNPLVVPYRDYEICTNPPPSAGGSLVAFTLKMMEKHKLQKTDFGSAEHLNLLVNAMRQTYLAREEKFDPNVYQPDVSDQFFDKAYLEYRREHLKRNATKRGSTTHFNVADERGNIASITTSNGEGSGYAIPETDIMLNNMLGEEDLNPNGFHQWENNKRVASMMSPTILLKNNQPVLATGTGGANRIRSVVSQVISNHVDFKMPLEENIRSPRLHWEAGKLDIEPEFNPDFISQVNTSEELETHIWEEKSFYFGGAHSIGIDEKGNLTGVGDDRRAGASITV